MNNIKLVSLKSDKKDLCKYIKSDSQLLIFKITLDYLLYIRVIIGGKGWNKCTCACVTRPADLFLILGSGGGWRLPRRNAHKGINNCLVFFM